MIFLWNVTNEDMDYQYGGLSYTIESGKRKKVEEAEGRFVLNALGQKGLTRLVFDDDGKSINEEQIKTDALTRNKEFKIRQIVIYNERNERRKASGQPYDTPTPTVRKYAAELGIELLQPYNLAQAEKGQIGKLTEENDTLKKQMSEMMEKFEGVMNALGKQETAEVKELEGGMIVCPMCQDKVLKSRLPSHMAAKHLAGKK